ncbi:MAG TPA: DoxX family membrane protein, partial [Mucilaginibacter sp.]|nr:DoxX family membrane protein [Mucilaginibacter sp.]
MDECSLFKRPNLFQKFLYSLFAFSGLPFVIVLTALAFINVNKPDNTKEIQLLTSLINISYLTIPVIVLVAFIAWSVYDNIRKNSAHNNKLIQYSILLCRCFLSAILLFYGLSKLVGEGQFHLGYQLYGQELGSMSGNMLAWAFFGYSKFYSYTIGIAEIAGGLLLMFRRTALLGAIFLFPVLLNITLIDYSFDVSAKDIITV